MWNKVAKAIHYIKCKLEQLEKSIEDIEVNGVVDGVVSSATFDSETNILTLERTNSLEDLTVSLEDLDIDSNGDDWGSQVVEHDNSLYGEGTSPNPLGVRIAPEDYNILRLLSNGLVAEIKKNTQLLSDISGVILRITYYGGNDTDPSLFPGLAVDDTTGVITITIKEGTTPVGFEMIAPEEAVNDTTKSLTINIVSEDNQVHRFISDRFLASSGEYLTENYGLSPTISNTSDTFTTLFSNANIGIKILATFCT